MANVEFFKQQAKNFLKDYNSRVYHEGMKRYFYDNNPRYFFDMQIIVEAFGIADEEAFTLMNAQHIVARLAGFSKWNELINASESLLEVGKLLLINRDEYDFRQFLGDCYIGDLRKLRKKSKKKEESDNQMRIRILEDWELYKKNNLMDVNDEFKLQAFKNEFLLKNSRCKIDDSKVSIDFSGDISAQDMLKHIMRKKRLSSDKAILSAVTFPNCVKILESGWAGIAVSLWGHADPDREKESLENPVIEVEFDKYTLLLLEVVMDKENVSLPEAILHFMIFELEKLGYHI